MKRKPIVIETNKHVLVAGMTGSGKSFLCETYLTGYENVIKLDTKNETDERRLNGESPWRGLVEGEDFTVVYDMEDLEFVETSKIIFVPPFDFTQEEYNTFFFWVFRRGNTILWVDELMSIGTANRYPVELLRLMTQARSKNIGCWVCTQRPSGIPVIVPSNCHYFFIFDMANVDDRKKMYQVTGMKEMLEMPTGYNFWFYKMGDRTAVKAILK